MPLPVSPFQIQIPLNFPGSGNSQPWQAIIESTGSPDEISMGPDGVVASLSMYVEWESVFYACQSALGYSEVRSRTAPATGNYLFRHTPMRHPLFNNLFCTRVARCQGYKFTDKQPHGPAGSHPPGPVSEHHLAKLTLQFTRPPYRVIGNTADDLNTYTDAFDSINNDIEHPLEYQRYVDRLWQPNVQMLSREKGAFKFSPDGRAGQLGDANTGDANRQFQGSVGTPIVKGKLTRKWYQIPQQAIYNSDGFPKNLFRGTETTVGQAGNDATEGIPPLGSINRSEFWGCAPYTLLLESFDIEPAPLQLPPELMALNAFEGENTPLQYNVTFHMTYFDPPRGYTDGFRTAIVSERGHNLMPWVGDQLWYPIQTTVAVPANTPHHYRIPPDATGVLKPFKSYPFEDLFEIL